MSDALFDPNAFGPPRAERQPAAREPVETTTIVADSPWKGVQRRQHGVVHAITNTPARTSVDLSKVVRGSSVSYCGKFVEPHTFAPGEVVLGCRKCIDRGAPATRADTPTPPRPAA